MGHAATSTLRHTGSQPPIPARPNRRTTRSGSKLASTASRGPFKGGTNGSGTRLRRPERARNTHANITRFHIDPIFMSSKPGLATNLGHLLGKLNQVAGTGRQWSARCPAHADNDPSLSVGISDDNSRILVHCHVDCETEDVLAEIGMRMSDLFSVSAPAQMGRPDQRARPLSGWQRRRPLLRTRTALPVTLIGKRGCRPIGRRGRRNTRER